MAKVIGFLVVFSFIMALALAISIPLLMLQGHILGDLWSWFIQPNFNVALDRNAAIGIMMIFSLIVIIPIKRGYEENKIENSIGLILRPVLTPLFIWALGAIMKFWIL